MNSKQNISASIVIYNIKINEIEELLKALHALNIHTYIIDNSLKASIERQLTTYNNVEYIFNNCNLGYGKAHNIGIQKSIVANFKYHIVVNPDIEIGENAIDQLHTFMEQNDDTGLCMPTIIYPNGEMQYLCKLLPSPFDLILRRFIPINTIQQSLEKRFELHNANYSNSFNVPSLSGCFMFLRNSTLKQIGLFDENIFMYCEDLDLCRRIGKVSKTQYVPTEAVIHRYNKESYRSNKLLAFHIKSAIYYFNKWGWIFDAERRKVNNETLKAIEAANRIVE
jgi:GT2 family glycosyltransferase